MCNFAENVNKMTFENCNLFKRSFTNKGIGFTFNNEKEETMIKKHFHSHTMFPNTDRSPSFMESTSSKHSLHIVIDNNAEEVERYERIGDLAIKPQYVSVSLHNPKEPANTRSGSFKVPLGYSTTFLITPKARKIDESGKELSENQRSCRLDEDTETLDIFKIYTRSACLFECKLKYSLQRCGCIPWEYPLQINNTVTVTVTYTSRILKYVTFYSQELLFCDIYGNICFENSMDNATTEKDCYCPMECNSISYSFSIISTPFNPKEMCPSKTGKNSKEFLMKQFYEKKFPSTFIRGLKHKSSRQIIAPLILFVYPTLQF